MSAGGDDGLLVTCRGCGHELATRERNRIELADDQRVIVLDGHSRPMIECQHCGIWTRIRREVDDNLAAA